MTTIPAPEDEPLLEGLRAPPAEAFDAAPPPAFLREAILRRTSRSLLARRVLRRAVAAACVVAAFLGGRVTASTTTPASPTDSAPSADRLVDDPARAESPRAVARLVAASERTAPARVATVPADVDARTADPRRLESLARRATGPRRAELFKAAGDRWLAAYDDVSSALRCYRAYREASASDSASRPLATDPSASWLLSALDASVI